MRRAVRSRDSAVAPVMGVLLMVALTVAIVVGVWVFLGGMTKDKPLTKIPVFYLADAADRCTVGVGDGLFTMRHMGGDVIEWSRFRLLVLEDGLEHTANLDWGEPTVGDLPGRTSVGDTLAATETSDVCTAGAVEVWTVQVRSEAYEDSIVFEQTVRVS